MNRRNLLKSAVAAVGGWLGLGKAQAQKETWVVTARTESFQEPIPIADHVILRGDGDWFVYDHHCMEWVIAGREK